MLPKEHKKSHGGELYGVYKPADPSTLQLESNFGPLEASRIGYLQPTTRDTPMELMRERFHRDGYLFVSLLTPAL